VVSVCKYRATESGEDVKVAIITPYFHQATTGNAVTARRVKRYLSACGVDVGVFSLDQSSPSEITDAVKRFSPDVIHAFHSLRCGPLASSLSGELHRPFIVTITGTDLYRDVTNAFGIAEQDVHAKASAIVTFQHAIKERVAALFPSSAGKLAVIPQGVELLENPVDEHLSADPFIFFLPAGIRPVKNVLFPLRPLASLSTRFPRVRLVIVGPAIDPGYAEKLLETVRANPFSSWAGEVPHSEMPQFYRSASVILNTSLSEGGMANSLLEGMAYNRPVLASAVEGNCFLEEGVTGLLYSGEAEFMAKAERLILDGSLRKKLGEAGRGYLLENCSPEVEAVRYIELYERVI
jgi:glycosyltransferase involved in cell wall biosynthesis